MMRAGASAVTTVVGTHRMKVASVTDKVTHPTRLVTKA